MPHSRVGWSVESFQKRLKIFGNALLLYAEINQRGYLALEVEFLKIPVTLLSHFHVHFFKHINSQAFGIEL